LYTLEAEKVKEEDPILICQCGCEVWFINIDHTNKRVESFECGECGMKAYNSSPVDIAREQ